MVFCANIIGTFSMLRTVCVIESANRLIAYLQFLRVIFADMWHHRRVVPISPMCTCRSKIHDECCESINCAPWFKCSKWVTIKTACQREWRRRVHHAAFSQTAAYWSTNNALGGLSWALFDATYCCSSRWPGSPLSTIGTYKYMHDLLPWRAARRCWLWVIV